MHRQQEQGEMSWEEYWDTQVVQGQGEEGKVQMELNVARDTENNKGLYRCVSMKRKGQSRCDTIGRLVTMDEKVEEPSLSISHEWWNYRTGIGGAKSLTL